MGSPGGLHLCGPSGNGEESRSRVGVVPTTREGVGLGYQGGEESEDMPRLGAWAAGCWRPGRRERRMLGVWLGRGT